MIATRVLPAPGLKIPICEILERGKREKVEEVRREGRMVFPLHTANCVDWEEKGQEDKGYWEVANKKVWEVLSPCLKLATMMLQHQCDHPWACTLPSQSNEGI